MMYKGFLFLPDGSVTVQFTAGGSKAICWHLFKWSKLVKILQPASLKKVYKEKKKLRIVVVLICQRKKLQE